MLLDQMTCAMLVYLQNVAAIQYGEERVDTSSAKVLAGSDEAAVMCLFDQALSENNFSDRLPEIVQKFQTPTILAISCEKLAECSVKVVFTLQEACQVILVKHLEVFR